MIDKVVIKSDNPNLLLPIVFLIVVCYVIYQIIDIKWHRKDVIREENKKTKRNFVLIVGFQAICVALIFIVGVMPAKVIPGSMEPTLMTSDYVIYNRLAYIFVDIKRGDIINFWSDEFDSYFSKRVIGVEGDFIEFRDGYVFINGMIADESAYLDAQIETNCSKTFIVPEGTVFVMGDNRENSIDSRFFEVPYISIKKIKGKYLGKIPTSRFDSQEKE